MNPLSRETKNFRAISEYKPTGLVRKSLLLEGSLAAQPLVFTNQRVVSTPMASTGTEATPPPKDGTENDDKSLQNQPPKSRSGDVYVAPHNGARYIYQKDIGSGTFSTVVLAINAENSHDCAAVKIVHVPPRTQRLKLNSSSLHSWSFRLLSVGSTPTGIWRRRRSGPRPRSSRRSSFRLGHYPGLQRSPREQRAALVPHIQPWR